MQIKQDTWHLEREDQSLYSTLPVANGGKGGGGGQQVWSAILIL